MRVVLGVGAGAARDELVRQLDAGDVETVLASDLAAARAAVVLGRPDAIVIDNDLGGRDCGAHAARGLRADSDVVIVLVGVRHSEARVAALESGIDECLAPGTDSAEVIARLRIACHRRLPRHDAVRVGDLVVDEDARLVVRGGAVIDLTRTEFDILWSLVRHHSRVVPVDALVAEVWADRSADRSVVQVHMSSLRRKLESSGPRLIHTVRGVGYVLRTPTVAQVLRADRRGSGASRAS